MKVARVCIIVIVLLLIGIIIAEVPETLWAKISIFVKPDRPAIYSRYSSYYSGRLEV